MGISLDDGRISFGNRPTPGFMANDPVCGMEIEVATAAGSSDFAGTTYYFCSAKCKESFDAEPERYTPGGSNAGAQG